MDKNLLPLTSASSSEEALLVEVVAPARNIVSDSAAVVVLSQRSVSLSSSDGEETMSAWMDTQTKTKWHQKLHHI